MNDIKEKIKILPCTMCELLPYTCEECNLQKEAEELYNKVIDEYKKALLQAFNETNINDYGFYPQNVVDMVAIKLKEQK